MKSIVEFIKESMNKFSKEELHADYQKASDVTGQEKKDLIAKYGVESKKAQDIKNRILEILRELRREKKNFDKEDITDFLRLHDYVTTRMIKGLKEEAKEFTTYLKDYYFDRLKSRKLENYALTTGLNNYRLSIADKDLIKTYQKIAAAVEELNPSQEKIDKDTKFKMINERITELMQDFKVIYLKRIENYAKNKYSHLSNPSTLEEAKNIKKVAEKKVEDYMKENNIRFIGFRDTTGRRLENNVEKARNEISKIEAFNKLYPTEKKYLDKCAEDGEDAFKHNVASISDRLIKNDLDINNISISDVKNDPKFFEMMLTDGKHKLYLRSIFAAQYSDKMIPHFRFIITERK